jgi:hypothetical protein
MNILEDASNQQSSDYTMVVDEAWILMEYVHLLREALVMSDNASYLVIDSDNVLLLSTLIQEIDTKGVNRRDIEKFKSLALELAPSLYVTPYQAIVSGIIPMNYEVIELNGTYRIQHRVSKLVLSQVYSTKEELDLALAKILIEENALETHKNDFVYINDGETLESIIEKFKIKLPVTQIDNAFSDAISAIKSFTNYQPFYRKQEFDVVYDIYKSRSRFDFSDFVGILSSVKYKDGFSFISNNQFDAIKEIETFWIQTSKDAVDMVIRNRSKVFELITTLPLSQFNYRKCELDIYADQVSELRSNYPELIALSDEALFSLFDEYQASFYCSNSWDVTYDVEFIFFILSQFLPSGAIPGRAHDKEVYAGFIIAFHLLKHSKLDTALDLAIKGTMYHQNLKEFTEYVAEVMRFLSSHTK